jgi:hypothetical protein
MAIPSISGAAVRAASGSRRWAAVAALAGLLVGLSGCFYYTADIRIAANGSVLVREHLRVDPQWKDEIQDTLQAAEKVLLQYTEEARTRGGKIVELAGDSAVAEFRYPSLALFDRAWPDSSDHGQQWDRSVFRRGREDGKAVDELILWRMSPPDRSAKKPAQRLPVLTFLVTPPAAPLRQNAHWSSGGTYGWRFTENMTAPDSVLIVWPATEK